MEKIVSILVDYEKSPHMQKPLGRNGESSPVIVEKKVSELGFPVALFSANQESGPFQGDLYSLLHAMEPLLSNYEHFIFFHTEMPLTDLDLAAELVELHVNNIADYTFGEHYPKGFSPFILNRGTLKKIQMVSRGNNEPYDAGSIERILHLDLNAYDVEMKISPVDLRYIRDAFQVNSRRNYLLVKSFYEADIRADKIEQRIAEKPSLLRPMPTYLTVNLCEKNNQNPIYLPQSDGNSEFPDFSRFMQQTASWMEKGYVEFSGTGEPLLHSDFKNILKTIASYPDFQFYLDTNGVYLDQYMDEIGAVPNLEVFININAPHRELYKAIHGSDDFEKAESNIEAFFARYPEKGYLQITRMMENEESLETFLERWRTLKDRIIIQKYNDFSGELEERKVVNLAPLTRFPCWKLQREMFIQADGSVSLCSQDYLKKNVLGNLEEASLQEIWENAQSIYASHWKENYPKICENCDQWYIFNF